MVYEENYIRNLTRDELLNLLKTTLDKRGKVKYNKDTNTLKLYERDFGFKVPERMNNLMPWTIEGIISALMTEEEWKLKYRNHITSEGIFFC